MWVEEASRSEVTVRGTVLPRAIRAEPDPFELSEQRVVVLTRVPTSMPVPHQAQRHSMNNTDGYIGRVRLVVESLNKWAASVVFAQPQGPLLYSTVQRYNYSLILKNDSQNYKAFAVRAHLPT